MSQIESAKLSQIVNGESNCIGNREPNQKYDKMAMVCLHGDSSCRYSFVGGIFQGIYVDVACD